MENRPRKANMQKYKRIIVSILHALLFAYLTLSAFGCNKSLQPTSGDSNVTNTYSLPAEALRIIRDGLADPDPLVRVNAIEVVATTRQIKLMPKVHRLLQDEFVPVRFAAALAVGDTEYTLAKKSVAQLLEDLEDEDVNVITAAAYTMGKLGSAEYFEVLRKAISSDDQTVRANAALLLGKTGDRRALESLYWALQDRNSGDKVVFQVAESMAMLGDEGIYPKLWTMLISAYADVRVTGIKAMGELGTPEAKNALITMLDDAVLEVRLAAAAQLGRLKDRVGESQVLEVFEKNLAIGLDTEASERANVLTALAIGQICTPALTKFLPRLLRNESKFVRIAAAKAVFQCTMR